VDEQTQNADPFWEWLDAQDDDLYNAVVDVLDYISEDPRVARAKARTLQATSGDLVFVTMVQDSRHPQLFMYWRLDADDAPVFLLVHPEHD
jgi:hypothetical protein